MKNAPPLNAPAPIAVVPTGRASLADYFELTKPRLNLLVVLTSAAGYYLGVATAINWIAMSLAVAGTALVAGGAAVLNQVYERRTDAMMRRTRTRPLPDGRVASNEATVFGVALAVSGLTILALTTNAAAALLALTTIVVYLVIYTPMKRRSPAATLVGAIPGALPPLIGWTAAHGSMSPGGWTLFAIVFVWQIPHFMAIAWLYRDDYRSAGFPMLPVVEPDGRRTGRQALLYSVALVPISIAPALLGVSGRLYLSVAVVLTLALLWLAARFAFDRTEPAARRLFFGSIAYLPLIWAVMILDH